ncbi:tig [Gossypium arboreum]|uniref:Tig n=1 Tax=Gossypium arboreum TaxID=29729 RepID=A0A0B0NJ19_GOSAR|nr:tig [Gossypium arboreum]
MATTSNCPDDSGNVNGKEGTLNESVKENAMALNSELQRENTEVKSRVEAMWEQMNKGIPKDALRQFSSNKASATNKTSHKASNNWMKYLQMRPAVPAGDTMQERWTEAKAPSATKETEALNKDKAVKEATVVQNNVSDEAKKLAAAALSAVKDAAAAAAAASNRGKIEDELDAYKKSSNQYLDKVSFLQRTDYREFERERDARLALQARRRPEMREDP